MLKRMITTEGLPHVTLTIAESREIQNRGWAIVGFGGLGGDNILRIESVLRKKRGAVESLSDCEIIAQDMVKDGMKPFLAYCSSNMLINPTRLPDKGSRLMRAVMSAIDEEATIELCTDRRGESAC